MTPLLEGFLGGSLAAAIALAGQLAYRRYTRFLVSRNLRRLMNASRARSVLDLHTEVPLSALDLQNPLARVRNESLDRIWRNLYAGPEQPSEMVVKDEATSLDVKVDSSPEPEKNSPEKAPPSAWDHLLSEATIDPEHGVDTPTLGTFTP